METQKLTKSLMTTVPVRGKHLNFPLVAGCSVALKPLPLRVNPNVR